ncbi:hypothetical protein COOONC_23698 [Cooperia oncophora]
MILRALDKRRDETKNLNMNKKRRPSSWLLIPQAYLHVYLHIDEPLPEPQIVTVMVRERLLNGDVGNVVATNQVELQRSGKAVLPLKASDVER